MDDACDDVIRLTHHRQIERKGEMGMRRPTTICSFPVSPA